MSKRNTSSQSPPRNPVAKFARQFNKAAIFKDKTMYQRKPKHKQREPSLIHLVKSIREGLRRLQGLALTETWQRKIRCRSLVAQAMHLS